MRTSRQSVRSSQVGSSYYRHSLRRRADDPDVTRTARSAVAADQVPVVTLQVTHTHTHLYFASCFEYLYSPGKSGSNKKKQT